MRRVIHRIIEGYKNKIKLFMRLWISWNLLILNDLSKFFVWILLGLAHFWNVIHVIHNKGVRNEHREQKMG